MTNWKKGVLTISLEKITETELEGGQRYITLDNGFQFGVTDEEFNDITSKTADGSLIAISDSVSINPKEVSHIEEDAIVMKNKHRYTVTDKTILNTIKSLMEKEVAIETQLTQQAQTFAANEAQRDAKVDEVVENVAGIIGEDKETFEIGDTKGYSILKLENSLCVDADGNIETKNFSSKLENESEDSILELSDANNNSILILKNYLSVDEKGNVKTKAFDSAKSGSSGETIEASKTIYCPIGETLQIYYKSIFNGIDFSKYKVICNSSEGKSYNRYFEITPSSAKSVRLNMRLVSFNGTDIEYSVISSININIESYSVPTNKTSKILFIGDSLTLYNTMQDETKRRLCNSGGSPEGYGLSGIQFVGRKQTNAGTKFEGTSGYRWQSYVEEMGRQFKLTVSGISSATVGSIYNVTMSNSKVVRMQIIETNIESGSGYIKLVYYTDYDSKTDSMPNNGTISKISGSGDDIIAYSSVTVESYSPFVSDGNVDFQNYFNEYCGGNVDWIVAELGTNDINNILNSDLSNPNFDILNPYFKRFLDALHAQSPNTKVLVLGLQKPSSNGGFSNTANSSDGTRYCRTMFAWNNYLRSVCESPSYSSYVYFADTNSMFDYEHNYPTTQKPVNSRSNEMEIVETNNVHPTNQGLQQIADVIVRTILKFI